jgi:hypothetical protein
MKNSTGLRFGLVILLVASIASPLSSKQGDASHLNPAALTYKLPADIKWGGSPLGASVAVLLGDPSKPGLYIELVKWAAHHNSRPHYHPNDRYITVISGTWWVNTGSKYSPETMVPMPPGSFVTHYGRQVHYDGAKDEDTIIEIVGDGPETATAAEEP